MQLNCINDILYVLFDFIVKLNFKLKSIKYAFYNIFKLYVYILLNIQRYTFLIKSFNMIQKTKGKSRK